MLQDFRSALRSLAARRWFAAAIIVTLALGIGINSTVFTLVNAVLFKPLPFPDGERLLTIASSHTTRSQEPINISYPDFLDYRAQTTSFEMVEAVSTVNATITEQGNPADRYRMARLSPGVLAMLRTGPILGRGFSPEDTVPGAAGVVLIGQSVWRSRYDRSPDVIGKAVRLNERPAMIIGVMPEGFGFPEHEDLWVPLDPRPAERDRRDNRVLLVIGLLKPKATFARASAETDAIARRLEAAYPSTNTGIGARLLTFNERFNGTRIRVVFTLMMAAVGVVLLVACANVANMLLARAISRQREMAIRSALGASRWRLVRQLLVESLVSSLSGGAIGLVLAMIGVRWFDLAVTNSGKPSWIVFSIDYVVVAYIAVLCGLAALVFGLAPALRSSRVDLNHALKEGGRAGSHRDGRLSGALVVVQFALAVVLLSGAGLLMRSFVARQRVNAFIPSREILIASVNLPSQRYPDPDRRLRFFETMEERLRAIPGVSASAIMSSAPGSGVHYRRTEIEGAPVETPADRAMVATIAASPGFFKLVELPMLQGRAFDARDDATNVKVAIVTRHFASAFWPGQDALGKRFRFNDEQSPEPWIAVIGVSADVIQSESEASPDAVAYLPYGQDDGSGRFLAVRAAGDAGRMSKAMRSEVQRVDLDLALSDVMTLDALMARSRWMYGVFGTLFVIFAVTALVMAGVGLYAVMSQATSRRTREIGIRIALGASPGRILRTVMRRGVVQLAIGLALGLGGALLAMRAMTVLLFGVRPDDPAVFGATALTLLVVGLVACWLPARRAATVPATQAMVQDDRSS